MPNNETEFIPVKKVINIINSCESEEQLNNCIPLIDNYVNQVKRKGVINTDLLNKRLLKEYKQKSFQIRMITYFLRKQKKEFEQAVYNKNNLKMA